MLNSSPADPWVAELPRALLPLGTLRPRVEGRKPSTPVLPRGTACWWPDASRSERHHPRVQCRLHSDKHQSAVTLWSWLGSPLNSPARLTTGWHRLTALGLRKSSVSFVWGGIRGCGRSSKEERDSEPAGHILSNTSVSWVAAAVR